MSITHFEVKDSTNLTFSPVKLSNKELLLKWFEEKHVKAFFYGDGLENTLRNLELFCQGTNYNGYYTFYHWIALHQDTPFAFMMTSPVDGPYDENDDYNQWYIEGSKTFTLDVLIGEKDFLGKGLAHVMIQQFILDQYADADYFIIDPEAENKKAIHVYEKVGFKKVGELCPGFNPKRHIMMRLSVDELRKSFE